MVIPLLVAGLVLAAVVYLAVQPPPPVTSPDGFPRSIGIVVAKNADGTNWTLTFTAVLSGMTPATTYLSLLDVTGASLLRPMALSSLPGGVLSLSGSPYKVFVQYRGVVTGFVSAEDVLSVGTTFAGTSLLTQGCVVQVSWDRFIVYSGTLQTYS